MTGEKEGIPKTIKQEEKKEATRQDNQAWGVKNASTHIHTTLFPPSIIPLPSLLPFTNGSPAAPVCFLHNALALPTFLLCHSHQCTVCCMHMQIRVYPTLSLPPTRAKVDDRRQQYRISRPFVRLLLIRSSCRAFINKGLVVASTPNLLLVILVSHIALVFLGRKLSCSHSSHTSIGTAPCSDP